MNTRYIQYKDYSPSIAMDFFSQRQRNLRMLNESQYFDTKQDRVNAVLAKAQEGLSSVSKGLSEENFANAIAAGMDQSSALSGSLESMAGNISAYFNQASQGAQVLSKDYADGYEQFESIVSSVLNSGRILVNKESLMNILSRLHPDKIQQEFNDVANPLGWIGELSGLALLSEIADDLLKSSFKGIPGVQVELVNTGEFATTKGQRLTTDNLMIIRDGAGHILFQLNLSNKLNTAYKSSAKTTQRPIKIRTTTVKAFLNDGKESWAPHIYNTISYHKNSNDDERVDYLKNHALGTAMRQSLGTQILYDHIFGTRGEFNINGEIFKDEVHLVAYGAKIVATTSILKNALFTKAMNDKRASMIQVVGDRASWFQDTSSDGWKTSPTVLANEFDAQRKINRFSLIYNQTLKLEMSDLR